jgi:hypothetical protein
VHEYGEVWLPLSWFCDGICFRIEPIIYETIIVRSKLNASRLLETMKTKSPTFFDANVRSLAFGSTVTFLQAKAILAQGSQRIVNFAVWGFDRNPSIFLPFIRLPSLRRLSLTSHSPSELNIPPSILSSLTHLILNGPFKWYQVRYVIHHLKHNDEDHTEATTLFPNLTHFGVDSQNWGSAQSLLKIAKNLKYFAIIAPPQSSKAIQTITQRIAELGDRRVVVVEHDYTIENWEGSVRGGLVVWDRVEQLVNKGCFSEQGDSTRWSGFESPRI